MADAPIFAQSNDTTVVPASFWGQRGWFAVPNGWHARSNRGQIEASPNADFSRPVYTCKTNEQGIYVFQDQWRMIPDNPGWQ